MKNKSFGCLLIKFVRILKSIKINLIKINSFVFDMLFIKIELMRMNYLIINEVFKIWVFKFSCEFQMSIIGHLLELISLFSILNFLLFISLSYLTLI